MELRQLRAFAAVARHASFTRAADELYVTQSALSQRVRKLEQELGVVLLRRTRTGAQPTAAGEALLVRAERILAEADGAREELGAHAQREQALVRVAAEPIDLPWLLPALVSSARAPPGGRRSLREPPADLVVGGPEVRAQGKATRL